jgi:hypothetical protein
MLLLDVSQKYRCEQSFQSLQIQPALIKELIMRAFSIGWVLVIALISVVLTNLNGWSQGGNFQTGTFAAVPNATAQSAGEVIALTHWLADGSQQLCLVDLQRKSLVVYHIAPGTGAIQLKSARRWDADVMLEEFNSGEPTPEKVRLLLGR